MSGNGHDSPVEKAKAKHETVDMLVDTIEHEHQEAYNSGVNAHLKGDNGQVDYDKLKDLNVRRAFAKTMADFYVEKARKKFGIAADKKLSDEERAMLLDAYAGITEEELSGHIKRYKNNFTHQTFGSILGELKGQIERKLLPSAYNHLEEGSQEEIVKHMKLEDRIDATKLTLEQAVQLLQTYHVNEGHVPTRLYEGELYHKKKQPAGTDHGGH